VKDQDGRLAVTSKEVGGGASAQVEIAQLPRTSCTMTMPMSHTSGRSMAERRHSSRFSSIIRSAAQSSPASVSSCTIASGQGRLAPMTSGDSSRTA
jgi:hypothetical protein